MTARHREDDYRRIGIEQRARVLVGQLSEDRLPDVERLRINATHWVDEGYINSENEYWIDLIAEIRRVLGE